MPIYRLLQNTAFDQETVNGLELVFEEVCRELRLAERTDPLRDTVARKVIELAKTGVHDPRELRDRTLEAFRE